MFMALPYTLKDHQKAVRAKPDNTLKDLQDLGIPLGANLTRDIDTGLKQGA